MTEYAIRYYRDEFWARRYRTADIANKPAGWVVSPHRYDNKYECLTDIAAINARHPTYPAELVVLWDGVER
jgi:hypothetical protein